MFGLKDESEMIDSHTMRIVSPGEKNVTEWQNNMRCRRIYWIWTENECIAVSTHRWSGQGEMGRKNGIEGINRTGEGPLEWKPSARHDALYSYFARLVFPLWNSPMALFSPTGQVRRERERGGKGNIVDDTIITCSSIGVDGSGNNEIGKGDG